MFLFHYSVSLHSAHYSLLRLYELFSALAFNIFRAYYCGCFPIIVMAQLASGSYTRDNYNNGGRTFSISLLSLKEVTQLFSSQVTSVGLQYLLIQYHLLVDNIYYLFY